jgi:diaminohydroxyphosphoribosylaminopyrimidine deaminase/5-amino-6-(5-phosphoribosylamino)uracil reductase
LGQAGVELIGLKRDRAGDLDLGALLDEFGRRGMTNVMIEGGGRTLGAFYDAGLADEAVVFVAPRLIGGREAISPLSGVGPALMKQLFNPIEAEVRRMGIDHMYRLLLTDPARM